MVELLLDKDKDLDRFWRVLHAYTLRRFRELLIDVTDLIIIAYVLTWVSVDTAFHEHNRRKVKVKALHPPLLLVPKSPHPVKLAAL
jgi:hypothetical protein